MNNKTKSVDHPTQKRIIVVNTGYSKKKFILQRIKQLGYFLIVVNKEKNWAQPYVDEWILVDTINHDQVIEKVRKYLKNNPVDGILTFWEDDVILTSKLTDTFNFIGIKYAVAQTTRNKSLFRKFCQDNQLPSIKFQEISHSHELSTIRQHFNFPVVLKPAMGSSSAFVIKANDADELDKIYQYVSKNISPQIEPSLNDGLTLLIEEYIDGDEVDIDLVLQNGKIKFWSISDNFATREPFFMENGQAIPTSLPEQSQIDLISCAEEVLEKLGVMQGIVHFEAKQTSLGPIPIEVNLRLGGDEVYSFVKAAWKYDLIENGLKVATGQYIPKLNKPSTPYKYLISQDILPAKSGIITSVDIPKKFPDSLKVKDCIFYKKVGDVIVTPPSNYEFLGLVSTEGDTPIQAKRNLDEALKLIEYDIAYFSAGSSLGKTKRIAPQKPAYFSQTPSMISGRAKIEKIRHTDLVNQRKLNVGIACNAFSEADGVIEADLTSVGKTIQKTLDSIGYKTTFIDFNQLNQTLKILEKSDIDIVFNVCERMNNSSLLEPHAASLLDIYQIPYTGSNPFTLTLSTDKIRVKKLLNFHKIPTAKWDYFYDLDEDIREDLTYPLIVKPANTHNSIGVSQQSVVENKKALYRQLEYVLKELNRPALVEEYLIGDEYDVSIIGNDPDDVQILPLSRNIYHMPAGLWNIYTMDDKFGDSSTSKKYITTQYPPKKVNPKLLSLISEIALDTYNILDSHDYGRVEVKLDAEGNPHVLELNTNPSINKGDIIPAVAEIVGMNYEAFLEKIISFAINRYKNRPPYYHLQSALM